MMTLKEMLVSICQVSTLSEQLWTRVRKSLAGTGETAQWLRAPATVPEDQGLISRFTTVYNSNSGAEGVQTPSSGLLGHCTHRHACRPKHPYT